MVMVRHEPLTPGKGFCCPKCEIDGTRVRDSRQNEDGSIKRRRECKACSFRFSTVEVLESAAAMENSSRLRQFRIFKKLLPRIIQLADDIDLLQAEHE